MNTCSVCGVSGVVKNHVVWRGPADRVKEMWTDWLCVPCLVWVWRILK